MQPSVEARSDGTEPAVEHDQIRHLFAADGPLARTIPGYRVRTQQVEMARDHEPLSHRRARRTEHRFAPPA